MDMAGIPLYMRRGFDEVAKRARHLRERAFAGGSLAEDLQGPLAWGWLNMWAVRSAQDVRAVVRKMWAG